MRFVTALTALVVLLSGVSGWAQGIPWNGLISVDSVEAARGGQFGVKVRLTNNDLAISGMEIPLRYESPYLTLDSVSFAGSLKSDNFGGLVNDKAEDRTVKITYVPDAFVSPLPTITAESGVLAELFFSLSATAPPGIFAIDSINQDSLIMGDIHWWTRIAVADNTGLKIYLPRFSPGAVVLETPTAVDNESDDGLLPAQYSLSQNYPNPFNPATMLEFSLPEASHVKLEVFNVLGQRVGLVADGWCSAGVHRLEYDASGQPSGIYFYRLDYGSGSETKKMVLVK